MFCPKCSAPKADGKTQFCTSCGLDLSGLKELVESSGPGGNDARFSKGIRHGVTLVLLGLIFIPVWMFVGPLFPPHDRLVESAPSTTFLEQLFWILMWLSFLAGAARIVYAFAFEKGRASKAANFVDTVDQRSLPSGDYFKPADAGRWRSTEELFESIEDRQRS